MYDRIIAYVKSQPWAILPEKAAVICDLLRLRAAGVTLTEKEIEARIGAARDRPTASQQGAVAVVPVFGTIAHRMNLLTEMSGGTSTDKLAAQIRLLVADPAVSAIVLDVNSPGGTVMGLTELAAEIRAARGKKPIVAVANALMASAAYWIGSQASEIVVTPSAQIGSIGVFFMHEDHSKELADAGVDVSLISAGKYKTEGNPFAPLSDEARAAIQAQVDLYYGMFTKDIAKGRKTSVETVRNGYGEGRVVDAQAAVRLGMADRLATLDEVIADLMRGSSTDATPQQAAAEETPAIVATAEPLTMRLAEEEEPVPEAVSKPKTPEMHSESAPVEAPPWSDDIEYRKRRHRILELG